MNPPGGHTLRKSMSARQMSNSANGSFANATFPPLPPGPIGRPLNMRSEPPWNRTADKINSG